MSAQLTSPVVSQIPVELIDVLNPRTRNARDFAEIVANIKAIGLKKPIMVTPRGQQDGSTRYLLICGEGRLTAFRSLGEPTIPAMVVDVDDEQAFIMSLTENIARRRYTPLELLSGIEQLHTKGYTSAQIRDKTGLNFAYVRGIVTLIQCGERRLMLAVQTGRIPLSAALSIVGAGDDDSAIQGALQDAYESGALKGKKLDLARKVVDRRAKRGIGNTKRSGPKSAGTTSTGLVKAYEKEVARQTQLVRKASFAQQRLAFVVSALQQLFQDENFLNLLRAESMDRLPKYLADKVWPQGISS